VSDGGLRMDEERLFGQRLQQVRHSIGDQLYAALMRVLALAVADDEGHKPARRKLSSMKQYLGPLYWRALLGVVMTGSLMSCREGPVDKTDSARISRDALALVLEWEEERARWGIGW